jgi:RNA polymerase sigma-70 factor (ECF subfamily)
MLDRDLIAMYEHRDESAIDETAKMYGGYCTCIAMNILSDRQDAEECVNDTWLRVWNVIPPERPRVFATFIGRITKHLSLDKYKMSNRQKRGGGEFPIILQELDECVSSRESIEAEVEAHELTVVIEDFLSNLPKDDRLFFMRRYYHNDKISDIAARYDVNENRVTSSLFRSRKKLRVCLGKEGLYA